MGWVGLRQMGGEGEGAKRSRVPGVMGEVAEPQGVHSPALQPSFILRHLTGGGGGGGVRVEGGDRVVLYLGVQRGSPEAPLLGSV